MRKLLYAVALCLAAVGVARADEMCSDFGRFTACIPITTGIDAAFGYDFRGHQSQGLAETPFGSWRVNDSAVVVFKTGAISSENGKGAPFMSVDYQLRSVKNPLSNVVTIKPGVYGGKDFNTGEWFYGLKAAVPVWR